MTREEIITRMCYTYRHDYGLLVSDYDKLEMPLIAGVTKQEQQNIWNTMAQIFDNDIAPNMTFKND
jgi:hypothetical protein